MVGYPSAPSKYPVTPGKYPAAPTAFPASTVARYPSGSAAPIDTTSPVTVAGSNCICWVNADYGIAFGGTLLRTTGTGTAVMTISGSPAVKAAIRWEVEAGGTTFKYFADGGTTPIETGKTITAGTYTAIGALAGVVFTIPASGTFIAGDAHEGVVAGWLDQSGTGNDIVSPTVSAQALYEYSGFNSRASLKLDGANDILFFTTGLAAALNGTNTPINIFTAHQVLTSAVKSLYSFGDSSSTNNLYEMAYLTTGPSLQLGKTDSAGVTKSGTTTTGGNLNRHNTSALLDASGIQQLRVDGVLTSMSALNLACSATFDRGAIGARLRNVASIFMNLRIREFIVVSGVMSAAQVTAMETYLAGSSPV